MEEEEKTAALWVNVQMKSLPSSSFLTVTHRGQKETSHIEND